MAAFDPGDFRPITVLPVCLKLTMRAWLCAASPYLELRRPPSHGFRAAWQPAEAHFVLRDLLGKHTEWDSAIDTCKNDNYKAYDILAWASIDALFVERGLPQPLRDTYWRVYAWRQLTFRTSSGAIRFSVTPYARSATGGPESPLIYAAVVENLIEKAELRLRMNGRPAGLRLEHELEPQHVEDYKTRGRLVVERDTICFLIFAGVRSLLMLEFMLAVLSEVFAEAGQKFNIRKCERHARHGDNRRPRLWSAAELRKYEASGLRPHPDQGAEHMKVVTEMTVLGSVVTKEHEPSVPLAARLKAAWLKYSKVRVQLQHRYTPLALRVKLMDSILTPTVLWGLETVRLPKTQRRTIDAFQRHVMARMVLVARKASESMEVFMRRRERVVTTTVKKHSRGIWGQIQQYRLFTSHGHLARSQSACHMSAQSLMWRGPRWWSVYRQRLPPRIGVYKSGDERPQGAGQCSMKPRSWTLLPDYKDQLCGRRSSPSTSSIREAYHTNG